MTPLVGTEHHFGPFLEKDFGAVSGCPLFSRPLCFLADTMLFKIITQELSGTPNPWYFLKSNMGYIHTYLPTYVRTYVHTYVCIDINLHVSKHKTLQLHQINGVFSARARTFVQGRTPRECGGGGCKNRVDSSFCISLVLQFWGVARYTDAGKTARNVSLSHPLLCAPHASRNLELIASFPYASRQSTGKMTNGPHFAHIRQGGHATTRF